jgi:antitoxin VapB
MKITSVFMNNSTQAVRLPVDARFPEGVKRIAVRTVGAERILTPLNATWDSFFLNPERPPEDFMTERAEQFQADRDSF